MTLDGEEHEALPLALILGAELLHGNLSRWDLL